MSDLLEISPVRQGVVAAFRDSPFATPGDYRSVSVRPGLSISDILEEVAESWQIPYARVILNDEIIAPEDWPLTVPNQGDVLNIVLVPQDGDIGQIFKALAVIVVTVAVAYFLGPQGAALVGAEIAAGLGAAAGLVTGLALNALFPPPAPALPDLGSNGVAEDPVYGFSRVANQANPYGTIPRVYGRRRVMPMHAMNPYVVASGSNQYLYQCFTAGYGPLKIEDILIGDTPIGNYKDVEYFIHESFMAGDELKICKEDVWTDPYSINLLKNAASTLQTTNDAEKVAIDIQFPTGLYQIDKTNGNHLPWTVDFRIEVAPVGSSSWSPLGNFSATVDGNGSSLLGSVTSSTWTAISTAYQGLPNFPAVDALPASYTRQNGEKLSQVSYDVETGFASYVDYENHYTLSGIVDTVRASGQFTKPFFTTVYLTFPAPGHYQIRITRLSDDQDAAATAVYCNSYLSSIRSYRAVPPVAPDKPISLIEMKIKATDQLNGSVNNLSCIVTSKLPVYQNGNWQILETRNPAWAYLDVLRGTAIPRPVTDSRIDLDTFAEWASWCEQPMANAPGLPRALCDLEVTSQTTVWETLKLIAGTGYATPSTASGKHSIAIDRPRSTPVQLFTPRNIKGLSGELVYHIQPHALRVQYTPTDSTTADEVVVFDDGYSADGADGTQVATRYETMKLVGVSRYEQAFVIGRRSLAQGKLRIETFKINCDAENLLATRGDFVRLSHDVPRLGSGWGRVVAISGNTITLDEDITATGTLYARVRTQEGTQFDSGVSSYSGATLTLSTGASGVTVGDVIAYGNLDRVSMDCLVKSVRPSSDFSATLELIPYAPAIYTAEVSAIPPYDPYGGQWTGGTEGGGTGTGNKTTPGQVTSLKASSLITWDNKIPRISITLSWGKPVTGGTALSYKIYFRSSNNWILVGTTADLSYLAFDRYQFVDAEGNPVEMSGKSLVFAVSAVGADGSSYPPDTAAHVSITPIAAGTTSAATLTAVGGVFEIILTWSYANTGFDAAYAELWGTQVNNRNNASLIAKVAVPQKTYHHVGLVPGSNWYYWVRFLDGNGKYSDWYPASVTGGVYASPSTDPTVILTQLNNAIDTTQLADELNQRINLIDDPDTVPGSVRALIKTETTNRTTADSALQSQITTIAATTNTNAAAIQTEATARANGDSANATLINQVQARLDTGDYAAVKIQSSANASSISGLNAKYSVQVDANGGVAGIMLNSTGVGTGSFIVSADAFKVYKPGYTAMPIFQVGSVNGVNAVGVNGNLVVDGTIVTRGIAGNAVTVPAGATGAWPQVTITTSGGPVFIASSISTNVWGGSQAVMMELRRNNNYIYGNYAATSQYDNGASIYSSVIGTILFIDYPPAGTHTYKTSFGDLGPALPGSIFVLECKR